MGTNTIHQNWKEEGLLIDQTTARMRRRNGVKGRVFVTGLLNIQQPEGSVIGSPRL